MTKPTRYTRPEVQRYGTFRELTLLGSECGGWTWWSHGCSDHVPGDAAGVTGGGGGSGDGGRS